MWVRSRRSCSTRNGWRMRGSWLESIGCGTTFASSKAMASRFAHPPRSRRCGDRRIMRLKPSSAIPLRRIVPTMKSSYVPCTIRWDTAAGLRSAWPTFAALASGAARRCLKKANCKTERWLRCGRFNWLSASELVRITIKQLSENFYNFVVRESINEKSRSTRERLLKDVVAILYSTTSTIR
jgi:hypothetical protein